MNITPSGKVHYRSTRLHSRHDLRLFRDALLSAAAVGIRRGTYVSNPSGTSVNDTWVRRRDISSTRVRGSCPPPIAGHALVRSKSGRDSGLLRGAPQEE